MKNLLCALAMGIAIVSASGPARATVIINANAGKLVVNNGIILVHNKSSKLFPGTAIMHLIPVSCKTRCTRSARRQLARQ